MGRKAGVGRKGEWKEKPLHVPRDRERKKNENGFNYVHLVAWVTRQT